MTITTPWRFVGENPVWFDPDRRAVQSARLQHRVAGGGSHRGSPSAHDDRGQLVDRAPLEQVTKQLNKLINVIKIVEGPGPNRIQREIVLIKGVGDRRFSIRVLRMATCSGPES